MKFNFFKKTASQKELALSMYTPVIHDSIKEPLKDIDKKTILTTKEQALLLLSHMYGLLEKRDLNKAKTELLILFATNNYKIKDKEDLMMKIALIIEDVKKIEKFFNNIPVQSHKFYNKDFLFDKNLNPIQKTLIMTWYVGRCKAIDSVFNKIIKKFNIE